MRDLGDTVRLEVHERSELLRSARACVRARANDVSRACEIRAPLRALWRMLDQGDCVARACARARDIRTIAQMPDLEYSD